MAVTIHVNGKTNSLVHKGSMGIAKSTIPDVCKTPSPGGPVPIPYPIIVSMSSDLKKGTKTVKVDGKKMAAVKGSEFSRCTGDEPGTAGGGVKSSTNMKEATWLLYSFDVKLDGKNACRLSDKMMMNHGNTACLGGIAQQPVAGANIPECRAAARQAKNAEDKAPEYRKNKPFVSAGSCFESKDGRRLLMGSSISETRGDKYKEMGFAEGIKKKDKSNVSCGKGKGNYKYPEKSFRNKRADAEAKIIEDIFKQANGKPKGTLYLKIKGAPVCCSCQALMNCAQENNGFEIKLCAPIEFDDCG
ncbi:MAG TPA: DUF4150 domain-containing protein [Nitrospirae bacterium]|nr:DUF4150 domain-containing protein [Nitrospirota bacterium]